MTKSSKKNLAFVVLYYGQWPWYWELWARSVANNPDIDFIIVTDLERPASYSDNVFFIKESIQDIERRFSKIFDFEIQIKLPHKICDYKSFYGAAFPDLLDDYNYWGYCDVDLIFGDLNPIVECVKEGFFDIISPWSYTVGHCTVVKNNQFCNFISLKTPNLQNRLSQIDTTFIDEGAFIETALKIGDFRIKIVEDISNEILNEKWFLGATIQPACVLSKINKNFIVSFKKGKIFVQLDSQVKVSEVLYFHFMSAKKYKYWKEYKGGDFEGCHFSRLGWIDKKDGTIMLNWWFNLKCSLFNLPDMIYSFFRGFVPDFIVQFYKRTKHKK